MEEVHTAWCGKGGGASLPPPGSRSPPPRVHQPRSSLNPVLLGFMEASLQRLDRLIKSRAIGNETPAPAPLPSPVEKNQFHT